MLEIEIDDSGVVNLTGRFDASQTESAQRVLGGIDGPCVIDLSGVEYISSAGLGVLLALRQRLDKEGATVTLRNMNKLVADVFRYSRLDTVFIIEQE